MKMSEHSYFSGKIALISLGLFAGGGLATYVILRYVTSIVKVFLITEFIVSSKKLQVFTSVLIFSIIIIILKYTVILLAIKQLFNCF